MERAEPVRHERVAVLTGADQSSILRALHTALIRRTVQEISLHLNMDVATLVIAELEDEITTIHHVKKNGLGLLKGIDLDKGRYIALSVAGGDVLTSVRIGPHGLQPPYRLMKEPRRIRRLINNFIEELGQTSH